MGFKVDKLTAIQALAQFAERGIYVFHKKDMFKLFPMDNRKALEEGLSRLVKSGILKRACRGVYVNENAKCFDSYAIEHIAKTLRRGEYNYVSLESMLSEYGAISQIPIDRLTIMTTGRKGTYATPYGIIEFTHTKRNVSDILAHIQTVPNRPLRVATKETAVRDLKRVGRNTELLLDEVSDEEI